MIVPLAGRCADRLLGVLSCYDRIVVTGALATVCQAGATTGFLHAQRICILAYPTFAMELQGSVRQAATRLSAALEIEHIARSHSVRKPLSPVCWKDGAISPAPAVVSAAKDLTPATRPVFDRSTRSFALLRVTGTCLGLRRSLARLSRRQPPPDRGLNTVFFAAFSVPS